MKYRILFLMSLFVSINSIFALTVPQLTEKKNILNASVKDFIKCLKGNEDCNPQKQKIIRIAASIVAFLGLMAVGAGVIYFAQKKPALSAHDEMLMAYARNAFLQVPSEQLAGMKEVIEKGANVNVTEDGVTPLMLAASSKDNNQDIVAFLIDQGAKINSQNERGTPLTNAIQVGNFETVKLLIDRGADVNLGNISGGMLPINVTIQKYNATLGNSEKNDIYIRIARYLIQKGAVVDPDAKKQFLEME